MVLENTTSSLNRLIAAGQGKLFPNTPEASMSTSSTGPAREESTLSKLVQKQGTAEINKIQDQEVEAQKDIQLQKQAQDLQVKTQERQLNETALNVKSQMQEKVNAILTDLTQRNADINFGRDKVKAEQASFLYRLSSEQYVSRLKSEGDRSRLNSSLRFKEELMDAVFSDNVELANTQMDSRVSLFQDNLAFRSSLAADDRTFERKLNQINIDQAWSMARQDIASMIKSNDQSMIHAKEMFDQGSDAWKESMDRVLSSMSDTALFSGLSGLTSGGINAYGSYKETESVNTDASLRKLGYTKSDLSAMTREEKDTLLKDINTPTKEIQDTNEYTPSYGVNYDSTV